MVQIQGMNQVGHVISAPGHHLIGLDVFIAPCGQPLLDEKDLRVVVCSLRKDPVTTSPRRDYIERQSDTYGSSLSAHRLSTASRKTTLTWANKDVPEQAVRVLHPITCSTLRRMEGSDVISETTGF